MLTIIIPTMNRPDFLGRLLAYYALKSSPYAFFVADGSQGILAEQNKEHVNRFGNKIKVSYYSLPGCSIASSVKQLLALVTTPYVTLLPDDDYLMPKGIEAAIHFLDEHVDYGAANGWGGLFVLNESGPYGAIKDLGDYKMCGLEGESGLGRLQNFLNGYFVALFSVYRLEVWQKMWMHSDKTKDVSIAAEIMPNSLAAVYCRIKHLDVFYILRQGHDRRYLLKDSFDWITSREWSNAVDVLRSALTTALQEEDSLALSEAQKEVKQVLWKYVQGSLLNGYRRFQNLDKPDSRVYILLGKLGLKPLGGLLKRFWLDKQRKISLTRLLDKNYDAYMDFKPLYNLITKK